MYKSIQAAFTEKKRKLRLAGLLIFLVFVLASCSLIPDSILPRQSREETEETEEPILTVPVTRGSIASSMRFVGNLEYSQSASLSWKTSGVIEKVNVKVGDQVKKGDILAVLETGSLSSSVILAEKNMIERQENLEDVKNSQAARMQAYVNLNARESALKEAKLKQEALYYPRATRQEMELAWNNLALAHLNFNYAKQDYDYLVSINESWDGYEQEITVKRFGRLMRVSGADERSGRERKFEEYVSAYNNYVSAYEKYTWLTGEPTATDYAVAEGNVQIAQMEYDKALEEYMSYEIMPREKDVSSAEISLNSAETSYNQRFIIAPFDGTVTSVSAVEGYYVARGASALRLDNMSRIFIPVSIPELDMGEVLDGTDVSITVDAIPGRTYSGHVYGIADASTSTGTTASFGAKIEVNDPDDRMLAGMTAEVSIPVNRRDGVLLIPNTALTYTDGKPYVTVIAGNVTQMLEVGLGITTENIAEVTTSNLREGMNLEVSSITPAALKEMGLDSPDNSAGSNGQQRMQPGSQRPLPGDMPAVPADISALDSTAVPAGRPAGTSTEAAQGPDVPEGFQMPPNASGQFQGPPGGSHPERSGEGRMQQPPGGSRPEGNGGPLPGGSDKGTGWRNGPQTEPSPTPAPTEAGSSSEKG